MELLSDAGVGRQQHVIVSQGQIDAVLNARPEERRAITRLHTNIVGVLRSAIAAGGSTLGDAQYVDLMGSSGSYQDDHHVYGRTGERCRTCGRGWIRHTVSGGRSTHFCPVCQR
ncbi:MAG: hypothetical protein ABWZ42_05050 [Ilumatobacteraceae bacterium]